MCHAETLTDDERNGRLTWFQLCIPALADEIERICDAFSAVGALAVSVQGADDAAVYDEPLTNARPLWPRATVVGLFSDELDPRAMQEAVAAQLGALPPRRIVIERLPGRAWERMWLEYFGPRRFGRRLWIVPSGLVPDAPGQVGDVLVRIDPGLAFGTGSHETTAMCLEWLDRTPLLGTRVIDFGCGSGILAVAAAALGATQVWATDVDELALLATQQNAVKNDVLQRITVTHAARLRCGDADILIANILAGPLIDLAPRLRGHCRRGGTLVLSGILASQADAVRAAYRPHAALRIVAERGGWVCLVGTTRTRG